MMQQPSAAPKRHPCRCETCDSGKKHVRILYPNGEEKTRLVKCEVLNRAVTLEESDIISLVGCCSHSSAPGSDARQRIETAIRKMRKLVFFTQHDTPSGIKVIEWDEAIALLKDGVELK